MTYEVIVLLICKGDELRKRLALYWDNHRVFFVPIFTPLGDAALFIVIKNGHFFTLKISADRELLAKGAFTSTAFLVYKRYSFHMF